MATAGDQINRALRLLGVLAEGEVASADTSNDALTAMNQMIDSWSTERLAVYATQVQSFAWPGGYATRTVGPTGDFVGSRPIRVETSTYFVDPTNISRQVLLINRDQYDAIPVKSVQSSVPSVLFVNMTYPNAELTVYPVPSTPLTLKLVSTVELSQPATLFTELSFPPGYLRAFTYNLACELAPEFGVEPSQQVQRIAMTSKRNLKRINNPDDVLTLPVAVLTRWPSYNIYAGNF